MNKRDLYTINSQTTYSSQDQLVMNLLYQPILGSDVVSFYNILWSELDFNKILMNSESSLQRLQNSLNINIEEFSKIVDKLIAIGLVKFYEKDEDFFKKYHFELLAPSSANCFFKNTLLRNELYLALGKDDYEKTSLLFIDVKPKIDGYNEKCRKYHQVFSKSINNLNNCNKNESYKNDNRANVNTNLDIKSLKVGLEAFNLEKLLTNKMIKQHIELADTAYKVSIDQLVDAIVESYIDSEFDFDAFDKLVKSQDHLNGSNIDLKLVYLNPNSSSDIYGNNSVVEFLNSQFAHYKTKPETLKSIETVMSKHNLRPSFMNILIEYMYKTNKFINKSYMDSLAVTISNSGYTSDQEVRDYLKKVSDKSNKSKGAYDKKSGSSPNKQSMGKNADLYVENVEKTSEEEQAKLKNLLDNI